MNPKLRDLQIQAFAECKIFEDGQFRTDEVFERFAKLIVRECGQVLVDKTPVVNFVEGENWDKGYDRAMNDCIHHIYEHFGVEE